MTNRNEIIETTKLMQAMKIDEVVGAFDEYQQLRERLERDGDFTEFDTSQGKKKAPTKQWRVKLERFFGLSVEIPKEWESKEENGTMTYHKRARAIHAKSGLFHEATGACNTNEKIRTLGQIVYSIKIKNPDWSDNFIQNRAKDILRDEISKAPHNAESHAETRAKNRAVLEFVGFGEVSAEELSNSSEIEKIEKKNGSNKPATPKQKDYIYGYKDEKGNWVKGIVESHLITEKDIEYIGESKKLTIEKANKILNWWWGDKKNNIVGEREKREK